MNPVFGPVWARLGPYYTKLAVRIRGSGFSVEAGTVILALRPSLVEVPNFYEVRLRARPEGATGPSGPVLHKIGCTN